jgi:GNAT superfamily N-acetyltransferase
MPLTPRVVAATERDVPAILRLIKALAEYERLEAHVTATEQALRASLFGDHPAAEAAIAFAGEEAIGLAVWFQNYSTFLGRRGIYLEDLFVMPEWRHRGVGRRLFGHVARVASGIDSGRLDWAVLDWNESAKRFYRRLGAVPLDGWTIYRLAGPELDNIARLSP